MAQPNDEEPIIVYPKTRVMIGYVLAGLVLLPAGAVWLLGASDSKAHPTLAGHLAGVLGGGALVTVAVLLLYLVLPRLIRPRPFLSFTHEGIRGTGGLVGNKVFVAWHEMTGVRLSGTDIVIDVKEPADIMKRAGWPWRAFLRINQSLNGTPVAIPSVLVPMPPQALAAMIEDRRVQAVMK